MEEKELGYAELKENGKTIVRVNDHDHDDKLAPR